MEYETYFRFLLALLLVLALIGALAWLARRFGFGGQLAGSGGKSARLSVVEVKILDSRRKLVLLRCDAREHLVLLGPNQDLLVERGIEADAPVPSPSPPPAPEANRHVPLPRGSASP